MAPLNSVETDNSCVGLTTASPTEARRSFNGWIGPALAEELVEPLGLEPTLPAFKTDSSNRQGCFRYTTAPSVLLTITTLVVTDYVRVNSQLY